jgi:hypothetical protein
LLPLLQRLQVRLLVPLGQRVQVFTQVGRQLLVLDVVELLVPPQILEVMLPRNV